MKLWDPLRSVSAADVCFFGGGIRFLVWRSVQSPLRSNRDSMPSLIPCHVVAAFGLLGIVMGH